MDEATLKFCIAELKGIKKGLDLVANNRIMETGKGDLLIDGEVLGLMIAITALENLAGGEDE